MKAAVLALVFCVAGTQVYADDVAEKYGGMPNLLFVDHSAHTAVGAVLCDFRSKSWSDRLIAAATRRIKSNRALNDDQRFVSLFALNSLADDDADGDFKDDPKAYCSDIRSQLGKADKLIAE
jgi:hypothetical protein